MAILQDRLVDAPWMSAPMRRLPGIQPLRPGDWLRVDSAYGAQLSEKARLLETRPTDVLVLSDGAHAAAEELLDRVLSELDAIAGFVRSAETVTRPDGVVVRPDPARPLATLSRLVQEDFCILQKQGDEHVLTGALLCFPASWTLAEKIGRPLIAIHEPVASYDADIARRVQRLFDAIRPDQPLWRANALFYDDPTLYQPRREAATRSDPGSGAPYIRSERQCLLRLPETQAVVFSIHTTQVARERLTGAQVEGLTSHPISHVETII